MLRVVAKSFRYCNVDFCFLFCPYVVRPVFVVISMLWLFFTLLLPVLLLLLLFLRRVLRQQTTYAGPFVGRETGGGRVLEGENGSSVSRMDEEREEDVHSSFLFILVSFLVLFFLHCIEGRIVPWVCVLWVSRIELPWRLLFRCFSLLSQFFRRVLGSHFSRELSCMKKMCQKRLPFSLPSSFLWIEPPLKDTS